MKEEVAVSLSESAAGGDRLAALRDLRDLLAVQVEKCESLRDLAALAGRLQSVLDEVARLEPKEPVGDGIDEIARRRTARRAGSSSGVGGAKRSG